MPAARILIVTNGHLCRNPRVLKEAVSLGEAAYDVTVLGVSNHPPSVPVDAGLLRGAPFRLVAVNTLPGGGPAAFRARLVQRLAREAAAVLAWKTIHALGPAAPVLARLRSFPADLTIVHNEIAHWAGTRVLGERRVAADLEDWHSEDLLPSDRRHRPLPLLRDIERTLLHDAAYVTTTSHALAAALHSRYGGRRPEIITNSFPLPPTLFARTTEAPPAFFWFSQTLGPGRGLERFLAAWSLTKHPSRVVLLGAGADAYRQALLAAVPVAQRAAISVRPLVPPAALPAVIGEHDIGLALEERTIVSHDLTISNKILQYLGAGLAIVASDTAGQREVLAHDPAAGIVVPLHDTAAFATLLDGLLADRAQLAARQAAARHLAETVYCWERERPRLLDLVATALASRA